MDAAEQMAARVDAFDTHSWVTKDAGGPSDPPDYVTYCRVCGIEHLGDPAEFPELEYPPCHQ